SFRDGKLQHKSTAVSGAIALRPHPAVVAFGDGAHNEESQAGALHPRGQRARDAVKAFEDLLELRFWDAGTVIFHADLYVAPIDILGFDLHLDIFTRVFNRVIDQVGDGGAHFIFVALNSDRGAGTVSERVGRYMVKPARAGQAILYYAPKIDGRNMQRPLGLARASGTQNLLDSAQQAIAVVEHGAIEF